MNEIEKKFTDELSEMYNGYKLNDNQLEQFRIYFNNLVEWNKVMNLTAITEEEDVYTKHFLDSLSIMKAIKNSDNIKGRLIDIGTGAGFPGLPLAIAFPELNVVLMDSLNKRIKFLDDTVSKLGLSNVTTIHSRAEDLAADKNHREKYDFVVSRAVANTSTLSEYCIPFVKLGGYFVAYKAEKLEEELPSGKKAIEILGGKIEDKISFSLPKTDYNRTLLVVKKIKSTAGTYPRSAGTPSKKPLGN